MAAWVAECFMGLLAPWCGAEPGQVYSCISGVFKNHSSLCGHLPTSVWALAPVVTCIRVFFELAEPNKCPFVVLDERLTFWAALQPRVLLFRALRHRRIVENNDKQFSCAPVAHEAVSIFLVLPEHGFGSEPLDDGVNMVRN
jgi:hypothetical protein